MLKPATAFLKPMSMLIVVLPIALLSGCGIELTVGDAGLCAPEQRQAMRELAEAMYEPSKAPPADDVNIAADKAYSGYEAACGFKL